MDTTFESRVYKILIIFRGFLFFIFLCAHKNTFFPFDVGGLFKSHTKFTYKKKGQTHETQSCRKFSLVACIEDA